MYMLQDIELIVVCPVCFWPLKYESSKDIKSPYFRLIPADDCGPSGPHERTSYTQRKRQNNYVNLCKDCIYLHDTWISARGRV